MSDTLQGDHIKLLIDGDILIYRMGFACEKRGQIVEPIENALHLIKKTVLQMKNKFKTHNTKIYLTSDDKSNFRFKVAKHRPYKGNRDPKLNPNAPGKPHYYNDLRHYILNNYNSTMVHDIEADDALGIDQCSRFANGEQTPVICSIDKDLDMIPGWHYNFVSDELYESTDPGMLILSSCKKKIRGTGYVWFYAQMLLGDRCDNIAGLKGYGPAKTFRHLCHAKDEKQLWHLVREAYYDIMGAKLPKKDIDNLMYEIADLLWIWRKERDSKSDYLRGLLQ